MLASLAQQHINHLSTLQSGTTILSYNDGIKGHRIQYQDASFNWKQAPWKGSYTEPSPSAYQDFASFPSFESFWQKLTESPAWWQEMKGAKAHACLTSPVITFHNELLSRVELSYASYRPLFDFMQSLQGLGPLRRYLIAQYCPNCRNEKRSFTPRYPKQLCQSCIQQDKINEKGEIMTMRYMGEWEGFLVTFTSPNGATREETHLHGIRFKLNGREYKSGSARGGGQHYSIWEGGKNYLI